MPRLGQARATSGRRISDLIAVWLLVWVFPPALVDRVIEECGVGAQRNRLLPPRMVVYLVLTMCLFPQWSNEEVMRLLAEAATPGLAPAAASTPTRAALSRARARLGPDPLKALFIEVTERRDPYLDEPVGHRRRTVTLDAAVLAMPDTAENLDRFSGPRLRFGGRSLPQVRLIGLVESDTHRILHAFVGSSAGLTSAPARALAEVLVPGDVLLADGGFADLALVPLVRSAGADVLWRIDAPELPVRNLLPDGSYLSAVAVGGGSTDHIEVRVLETRAGAADAPVDPSSRLVTSMLDHRVASHGKLLSQYQRRWTIGDSLGEIRLGNSPGDQVLRSRWPDGVEQELWGLLLVQHAAQTLRLTPAAAERSVAGL